jgi:hypothetical protein
MLGHLRWTLWPSAHLLRATVRKDFDDEGLGASQLSSAMLARREQ